MHPRLRRAIAAPFVSAIAAAVAVGPAHAGDRAAIQTTQPLSQNMSGGVPNGPSGNSVISGDKRYARVIAFQSLASDLVPGDVNGQQDVFAVLRGGSFGNEGSPWVPDRTVLISRTSTGEPANGPSFNPSVDGAFQNAESVEPSCVAYLSAATNIVPGDANGRVDAFVAPVAGGAPKRVSPDVGADTTAVAVSGDCSYIATITGDRLYLYDGRVTRLINTEVPAADPSFGVGRNQDLVFATPTGAWLLPEGQTAPRLVAPGGANPAYNDVKRQVVAYEKPAGGNTQIFFRDLGRDEEVASSLGSTLGNGGSRKPVLGNSGYSLAFETDATNLGLNALKRTGDSNGATDVYLYTDVRKLTLVQSVQEKAVPLPGGGRNPSMSFYNNYMTFDSPAPLGSAEGPSQVFLRYLGGQSVASEGDGFGALPDPVVGKSANVGVVSGVVYYKPPGNAGRRVAGAASNGFIRLTNARQVPMGSTMDTTHGRVQLETAVGTSKPGTTQNGQFYQGLFQIRQPGNRRNPITELAMTGPLRCVSARAQLIPAARSSRALWGSGKGRFRTRGRNASATVRGTVWLTKDSCNTTTVSVKQGTVVVRDFARRKNITVTAGHRYRTHR